MLDQVGRAQFAGDQAPFDTLDNLCGWAADLGYKGVQIPTWASHLVDVEKAATSKTYADELKGIKKEFGSGVLGDRRTAFGRAPAAGTVISIEAFVEKEPITVLLSKLGWVRTIKGHENDLSDIKYKEGDEAAFEIQCQTTDKLTLLGSNGRFYTLGADKLPRGKAQMEVDELIFVATRPRN